MSVDVLLARLHNVKSVKPGQWVAGCPLCQSKKGRPVAITERDGGKILLNPFCGCETPEIVKALGLRMVDLFPPSNGHHSPPITRRFSAEQVLLALAHEIGVAEVIAVDVERTGDFTPTQRQRMGLIAARITAGLNSMSGDRVADDLRRIRQAS